MVPEPLNSPATIRLAASDDTHELAALRVAWTAEQNGHDIVDDDFQRVFDEWYDRESDQRLTWMAEIDGSAVGMLNMLEFTRMPRPKDAAVPAKPTQWGYIANVYVLPEARGDGIAARLLDACLEHAEGSNYIRIVLSPSAKSIPVYERAGFEPATTLMIRTFD